MRKLLLCVLAAIMLVACGKDDFSFNVKEEIKNPYAVTPEEAVQLLQTVIGDETTRSVSISEVQTLTKGNFTQTTRSGADDEVIYIVDIEGGGSAIMGADKRMEPIYAVFDSAKISAEELLGATTRSSSENRSTADFMFGLLNNAIQSDIQKVEQRGIEMPLIPRDHTWSDTTVLVSKDPLLNTEWYQSSPFNDNYDYIPGTQEKYAAGCGIIALAQILYYHRYPDSINNNPSINWELLAQLEKDSNSHTNSALEEAAKFTYQIKEAVGANYNASTGETGITIEDARDFMYSMGYANPTVVPYTLQKVITYVANHNIPLFMGAFMSNGEGHAWVVDGCKIYKIDHWVRHYTDATFFTEFIENTVNCELVNCVMGYEEIDFNGLYNSGVFNPDDELYNVDMELITYGFYNN